MANTNFPTGFVCQGAPLRAREYTTSAICYPGDLVNLGSAGTVAPAAASALITGLCIGYAASGGKALIADHPDQLIVGQAHGASISAQTLVGNTCDILATAGDATYRVSRQEVDDSTAATTSQQLQVLGIEPDMNNAFGANAKVVCRINKHQYGTSVAGI